jgi:GT2 family glycosyltransferase
MLENFLKMNPDNEKSTESPLVSVIIVNWNRKDYLEECLPTLINQSFKDFEIILVDNGSSDDSVSFINQHYNYAVRLIQLPVNKGFAGGNNVGIKAARGEYIALLNNDTEVEKEWLYNLVNCMQSDDRIGMVGSRVLNYYRRKEIDNTGHLMYPDGLNRGRGRLEEDRGQFDTNTNILFPSGCAALYRKMIFDASGGFDETFFAYGDDADIGLFGNYIGYRAVYCPQAVVYHKYSGTAGSYSLDKMFYVERNRIWLLVKYFPLSNILASPYFTLKRIFFHAYGALTKRGAAGQLARKESVTVIMKSLLSAYLSAFKGILEMVKKRNRIRKCRMITDKEFNNLLKLHKISCREIALKE